MTKVVYERPIGRYRIDARRFYWTASMGGIEQRTMGMWSSVDCAYSFNEAVKLADAYSEEHRFIEVRVVDTEETG